MGARPIDCGCSLIADLFGFAAGAAIADFEHFDLLDLARRVNVDFGFQNHHSAGARSVPVGALPIDADRDPALEANSRYNLTPRGSLGGEGPALALKHTIQAWPRSRQGSSTDGNNVCYLRSFGNKFP